MEDDSSRYFTAAPVVEDSHGGVEKAGDGMTRVEEVEIAVDDDDDDDGRDSDLEKVQTVAATPSRARDEVTVVQMIVSWLYTFVVILSTITILQMVHETGVHMEENQVRKQAPAKVRAPPLRRKSGRGGAGFPDLSDSTRFNTTHELAVSRQLAVKEAFLHAWKGYKQYAWGYDTLHPVSKRGSNDFLGMALSITDSLDTALLMDLEDIFEEQYQWAVEHLKFDSQENINVFETTIRILGGLLSSYDISKRKPLLDLAHDLGKRLLPAFDTKTGLPYGTVGFKTGRRYNSDWVGQGSSVAEAGTLLLEFRFLSHVTGDPAFRKAVDRAERFFWEKASPRRSNVQLDGLFTAFIHPETGEPKGPRTITFGANGDSLYEYFLKGFLQTKKSEPWLLNLYETSMKGMIKHMLKATSGPQRLAYLAELDLNKPESVSRKMDHLVCFVPGMLALGSRSGAADPARHMNIAKRLMRTCYSMYATTMTGLAPEIVALDNDDGDEIAPKAGATHHLIRPETVESLFVLWRLTKDPIYREMGWNIFERINRYDRVPSGGFSGIKDVDQIPPVPTDKMDSFFLAETLKYLYLLFSPDSLVPLDQYVFNTEGHPLPMF